jgi:hypothetical protein
MRSKIYLVISIAMALSINLYSVNPARETMQLPQPLPFHELDNMCRITSVVCLEGSLQNLHNNHAWYQVALSNGSLMILSRHRISRRKLQTTCHIINRHDTKLYESTVSPKFFNKVLSIHGRAVKDGKIVCVCPQKKVQQSG